jgi:hypothetical protein
MGHRGCGNQGSGSHGDENFHGVSHPMRPDKRGRIKFDLVGKASGSVLIPMADPATRSRIACRGCVRKLGLRKPKQMRRKCHAGIGVQKAGGGEGGGQYPFGADRLAFASCLAPVAGAL